MPTKSRKALRLIVTIAFGKVCSFMRVFTNRVTFYKCIFSALHNDCTDVKKNAFFYSYAHTYNVSVCI